MKDKEELLKADIEELKKELKETKMDKGKNDPKKIKQEIKKEKKEEKEKKPFEYKKFLIAALPFIIILCLVMGIIIGRELSKNNTINNQNNNNIDDKNNIKNNTIPEPVQPPPLINQCIDSDGGLNPNVSGQVIYNEKIYQDYCLNNKTVEENYCSDDNVRRTRVFPCTYCENNSCIRFISDKYGCLESDSKIDIYKKGIVYDLNGVIGIDFCRGDTIIEYYCDLFGYIAYTTKICEKCESGACLQNLASEVVPKCTDTDGVTYDKKGTVTDINGNTATDNCQTKKIVQEFYCDSFGYINSRFKICENVCDDGKCIPFST
ncbi:MAG: hypothetical protein QXG00_03040 [Candidatus Woesearchaeota archaeon]